MRDNIIFEFLGLRSEGYGLGDLVNKISYHNVTIKKPTKIIWHYPDDIYFNKVEPIKELIFKKNNFIIDIKKPHMSLLDRSKYLNKTLDDSLECGLINHEYDFCKVQKSENETKNVAVDFYVDRSFTNWNTIYRPRKIVSESFLNDVLNEIKSCKFDFKFLFHINNMRGGLNIINDPRKLIEENLRILSDVDFFIGVEGGWSHIARSMRIPSLLFHRVHPFMEFLLSFVNDIQNIEFNEDEFLFSIKNFLSKDK